MSKTTAQDGTRAGSSETNSHNRHDPRQRPDDPAEWLSGAQWADELDVAPESPIANEVGPTAWKAVRKFHRQHEIATVYYGHDGMSFADLDTVPAHICTAVANPSIRALTRKDVAAFAEDAMTEDPHEIGKRLKQSRAKRFREKDKVERDLKAERIPGDRLFALEEAARACGADVAAGALSMIERANRRAWNTPKPHDHREHEYLITASELHAKLAVPVQMIAVMTPASEKDQDAALDRLSVARARHRNDVTERARAGDADPDDGSPLYADIGQLLDDGVPDPPTPDILRRTDGVGLFYRSEINQLYGDPEDGKTMIALAACAETLRDGGVALFVDLDDNGVESIVARLVMLGAPPGALREGRFRYCSPAGRDRLEAIIGAAAITP